MNTVTNEGGDEVEAAIFVGITDSCTMLRKYPLTKVGYEDAVEFIGTLENHENGIYYLDCPVDPSTLGETIGEIRLSLSEYEASLVTGGLETFIDQHDSSYPDDADNCKALIKQIERLQRGEFDPSEPGVPGNDDDRHDLSDSQ